MAEEGRKKRTVILYVCAVIVLLCGIGNFVMGIEWRVRLPTRNRQGDISSGIWPGFALIIAGSLGLGVGYSMSHRPNKYRTPLVFAFLMTNTLAFGATMTQFVFSGSSYNQWLERTHITHCEMDGSSCNCYYRTGKVKHVEDQYTICKAAVTYVTGLIVFITLSTLAAVFTLVGLTIVYIYSVKSQQHPAEIQMAPVQPLPQAHVGPAVYTLYENDPQQLPMAKNQIDSTFST